MLRAELGLTAWEAPLPQAQVKIWVSGRLQHSQGTTLCFVRPPYFFSSIQAYFLPPFPANYFFIAKTIVIKTINWKHTCCTVLILDPNRFPVFIGLCNLRVLTSGTLVTSNEHALSGDLLVEVGFQSNDLDIECQFQVIEVFVDGLMLIAGIAKNRNDAIFPETLKRYQQRCLLYTSPSPRDGLLSRMPSSA